MQTKHHIILYSFLSIALLLAVFLGVDYSLRAAEATQVLEDSYVQRVLETQEHLQAIGVKLAKLPAASDTRTQIELLTGVSKQADGVVTELAALPLSHIAMSDTVKFCNQLSDYVMTLALTAASGTPVSTSDLKQLGTLENQCALLLGQFVTARETMLNESLRMSGSADVFYAEAQLSARPLEQVADGDNGMDYPSMIYDGAFSDARHFGTPKALGSTQIDAAKAVDIAKEFIGAERVKEAASGVETSGNLASYGVNLTLHDGTQLSAEVTKQGGKPLWIVPEHANFGTTATLEECMQKGLDFLRSRGYGELEANHYQVYDGIAVINFVAVQDGVLLYPDLVKLQLRMDTLEVVGLEANNYLMNHMVRVGLTPTLSKVQALAQVSRNLRATDTRLCLIPYQDEERLCYEIACTYNQHEYLVYIDALTGAEVQILMILDTANGEMSA
ncbi:MAG: germination protein YpeB [Clostridia bacterium]